MDLVFFKIDAATSDIHATRKSRQNLSFCETLTKNQNVSEDPESLKKSGCMGRKSVEYGPVI